LPNSADDVRLGVVEPKLLHPLRLRVLRPGQPPSSVDHDYDYLPDSLHVGARDAAGVIVACATLYPEPTPDGRTGWRLRAMATAPEVRGKGYGASTLRLGMQLARERGATLLWCNARSGAVWFYERLGFTKTSEEFEIPPIGPHFVMEIEL
jgi:predicted GNAT family N-acyltransferase